ncbi:hypothetical protein NC652_030786 [Populus alba x Populus x berolinensis]|nr:hypothetical protein NC652_030786 [Populus alba x Populus x berolinensis]
MNVCLCDLLFLKVRPRHQSSTQLTALHFSTLQQCELSLQQAITQSDRVFSGRLTMLEAANTSLLSMVFAWVGSLYRDGGEVEKEGFAACLSNSTAALISFVAPERVALGGAAHVE